MLLDSVNWVILKYSKNIYFKDTISLVRAFIEITVVILGQYLGGTVGFGTLIFAFSIGTSVSCGLNIVKKSIF